MLFVSGHAAACLAFTADVITGGCEILCGHVLVVLVTVVPSDIHRTMTQFRAERCVDVAGGGGGVDAVAV